MGYQACITELVKATGIADEGRLEELLDAVVKRKARLARDPRLSAVLNEDELLLAAAKQISGELVHNALVEKRNALLNLKRRIARRQFYEAAPDLRLGIEAKLVGVNTPFQGARLSVDAQARALTRDYMAGMVIELDRAGLEGTVRRGDLDGQWARELYELNRAGGKGKPGVTGSKEAAAIAGIVRKYQRLAVDNLNRAGADIGDYDGWIARSSHDPDLIRRAGFEKWRDKIIPLLDDRTFDNAVDPEEFLKRIYNALTTGVHLTGEGLQGFKDPEFSGPGNLAKRLSKPRILHFKDAASWLAYHREFSRGHLIDTVLRGLDQAARHTALMREFGTNPRAEFEADLRYLEETTRDRNPSAVEKLRARTKALASRFDEIDGTAQTPVNRQGARIASSVRAVEAMAKLGNVLFASVTDIPFKAAELRYQGIGLLQSYADGVAALLRGRGRGEARDIADALRAGADGIVGTIAARFDSNDTLPGIASKFSNWFYRLSGLTYWTDAQKAGAELLMSRRLGQLRGKAWTALPEETRRVLGLYGIDSADWRALDTVDWRQANNRAYLTPDIALGLDERVMPRAAREELAAKLAAFYADRADFAVPTPGARERAMLNLGTRRGTVEGEALRFMTQFKSFPVAAISKVAGRELHGGQGKVGAVAGIVHLIVGTTIFGYLAMVAKDLAKGRTPRDPTDPKTWLAAFVQGGGAGIYGDFLFGDFNRFGRSLLASLAGPTLGQIDDVAELWSRFKRGDDFGAQALRLAENNTPFINLFYTRLALDHLILFQIQEALNPGGLRRYERRVREQNGQSFFLPPSAAVK